MRSHLFAGGLVLVGLLGCQRSSGTEPPPTGWANLAPTEVTRVVDRKETQFLEVRQGELQTWVHVPQVGAKAGDYILLGQGTAQYDVEIPELGERVKELVEIKHARVVSLETARRTIVAQAPKDAVSVARIYAELDERADKPIVVYGAVVKATGAVGWTWVHLRDGTGDASDGTHDLTVQTKQDVIVGQRVAFRGILRKDVELGFGYHYDALVEAAEFAK